MLLHIEAQENADEYSNEVQQLRNTVARCEEEKQRLEVELVQIKEMLQREVKKADLESQRNSDIITEYKQVSLFYFIVCAKLNFLSHFILFRFVRDSKMILILPVRR